MKNEKLFNEMLKAMEEAQVKHVQYLIAKRDMEAAIKAYKDALHGEEN